MLLGALLTAATSVPATVEAASRAGRPVVVVVTHATVQRAGRLRFALASFRLVGAMRGTPGLVAQQQGIRRLGAEVWTVTAWTSDDAMRSFVRSGPHAEAMRDAAFAIIAMDTWHLECKVTAMPSRFADVERLRAGQLPEGCRRREAPPRGGGGGSMP
jgi:heme-degrading monooxygenase HmoA